MTTISSLGVGSGLDLNSLLDQLEQGENKKLVPITTRKQSYQTKISAFGALSSALTSFQDAVKALNDTGTFQAVTNKVSGEALTATTTSDTPPGDYHINVTQRAQASSAATLGVADKEANLGAGTISLTLGGGKVVSVDVGAEDSSLEDIRDAINAQADGVRASLISDGSDQPYRLVLTASETGTEAAVSDIQFSGALGSSLSLDPAAQQAGLDAKLTVNGIQVTSPSNSVEGAIQGVTLNLTDEGEATLQVNRDDKGIKKAVTNFVDAYNQLQKTLDTLTSYNADSGSAGVLLGNSTVRSVESRLSGVLSGAVDDGTFGVLSNVGVQLQLDGTLKVDDDKLDAAVSDNLGALQKFFAGNGESVTGMAGLLNGAIDKMTGDQGLIANATDGLNQSIDSLDDLYDRTQQQINSTMARYRSQFSQLDGLIAKMNSTSNYLTQQFEALSNINKSSSSS